MTVVELPPMQHGVLAWVRRRTGITRLGLNALPTATELFLDVVFVITITQTAAALARTSDVQTMIRGFAILQAILMYWTGLVLAGSVLSAERRAMRPVIITATVGLVIVALTVPEIITDGYS